MRQIITFFTLATLTIQAEAQFSPLNGPNGSGFCSSVYAGDNFLLAGVNNDLYKSIDDGQTWFQITNGLPDNVTPDVITGLDNVVVIGTNSGDRCYRSTDDGDSWTPITEGLPDIFGTPAAVPDHACTYNGKIYMSGTNFIRRSSDEGLTWETMSIDGVNFGINTVGSSIWAAPNGQISISVDEGQTWTPTPAIPTIGFGTSATCFLLVGSRVWVGTNMAGGQGLFYTDDLGATYQDNNTISLVEDLAYIGGVIYCTAYDGLWSSTDEGNTWNNIVPLTLGGTDGKIVEYNGDVWFATSVGPLKYDPETGDVFYPGFPGAPILDIAIGNDYIMATAGGQLFGSNTEGASWINITENIAAQIYVEELHFDNGNFFALAGAFGLHYLYISSDNGASWTEYQFDDPNTSFSAITSYNPIIAASYTNFTGKIWYSNDGGDTFIQSNANLGVVNEVLNFHVTDSYVFANLTQGYAVSEDDGVNWLTVPGLVSGGRITIAGWDNRLIGLFVTDFLQNIVYRESTDGGETWTDMMDGLPGFVGAWQNRNLYTIGDRVYLHWSPFASDAEGKFYSIGQSGIWQEESDLGSIMHEITSMQQFSDGSLYAGTNAAGVWTNNNSIPQNIVTINTPSVLHVFPNPSEGIINVNNKGSDIMLFSMNGVLIKTITSKTEYTVLDISELSKGLYLLKSGEKSCRVINN